ncbi:MAG TPA: hypothetical protein VH741_04785, partial [Candidatus Limnocylindrales bacterium]
LTVPEAARLSGVDAAEIDEGLRMAYATNTNIISRGRSETALAKIKQGANGKPEQAKPKSLKPIDRYLGYTDSTGDGLDWIPFKPPKPPDPLEMVDLAPAQVDAIVKRYHYRKAEYERYRPDIEHWMANDFVYIENGKAVLTRLGVDGDGFLILTHNGRRVVGDTDLFHVFGALGDELPVGEFDRLFRWLERTFDLKHGITMNDDFGVFDAAERRILEDVVDGVSQVTRAGRQGTGMIAMTPEGIFVTRVDEVSFDPGAFPNQQSSATYVGLPAAGGGP